MILGSAVWNHKIFIYDVLVFELCYNKIFWAWHYWIDKNAIDEKTYFELDITHKYSMSPLLGGYKKTLTTKHKITVCPLC